MVCISEISQCYLSVLLTETFSDGRNERLGNPVLDGLGGPGHWTICIESSNSLIKMLSACCFWNFSKASFRGSCYAGNYRSSRWKRTNAICVNTQELSMASCRRCTEWPTLTLLCEKWWLAEMLIVRDSKFAWESFAPSHPGHLREKIGKYFLYSLLCIWNNDKSKAGVNIKYSLLFIQIHFTLMSKILFLCFIYCSVDCSFHQKTNVLSWIYIFFFSWHLYCECQLHCVIVALFWQVILQPNLMPIVRWDFNFAMQYHPIW